MTAFRAIAESFGGPEDDRGDSAQPNQRKRIGARLTLCAIRTRFSQSLTIAEEVMGNSITAAADDISLIKERPEAKLTIKPHMTPAEIDTFLRHLTGAQHYLEFGCGGSTCAAGFARVPKITSIDSDAEWIEKCRDLPELRGLDVELNFIDVGPTKAWGIPAGLRYAYKWADYYTSIWAKLDSKPDVVLVDGRWRVACALQTILHTEAGTKIMIHDFIGRAKYYPVLNFCDLIEVSDTLVVLKARDNVDWRRLAVEMTDFAKDYG